MAAPTSLRPSLAERFRDRLPLGPGTPIVTLGEGGTPLLPAPRLSERLGLDVWLKWEGANPTGSFKDRGMTVAVSMALEEGVRAVVCASTGNTAASAAAVAAALDRSGGRVVTVDDAALLDAWRSLAHEEGVFCEPASAAGVAGLAVAGLEPGSLVVCVVTGHGLKDPETASRLTEPPV